MSRVVVVGAGAGGLATAARLARLRHKVVVVEQDATVGGRWRATERDAFRFCPQPAGIRLPAALRDLFLKTGRRLEDAVELTQAEWVTEHVFADGTRLTEPAGEEWERFVRHGQHVWENARTPLLEAPAPLADLRRTALLQPRRARLLSPHRSLCSTTRRISDPHLRAIAEHYGTAAGWPVDAAPATAAALPYVERSFLVWSASSGPAGIVEAIHHRALAQGAVLITGARVREISTSGGRVDGVRLQDGRVLPADVVVSDVGDASTYGELLAGRSARSTPPAVREILLGLRGRSADRPTRVVLHGAPAIDVRIDPVNAPAGHEAVTAALPPGDRTTADEVVARLTTHRGDVRDRIVVTAERSTAANARPTGRLPRPAPTTEVTGLFTVGRSAAFGRDLAFVVMSAAAVAELVGRQ